MTGSSAGGANFRVVVALRDVVVVARAGAGVGRTSDVRDCGTTDPPADAGRLGVESTDLLRWPDDTLE